MRQAMLSLLSCGEQVVAIQRHRAPVIRCAELLRLCDGRALRVRRQMRVCSTRFAPSYFVEVLASSILAPAEICCFRRPFGASYGPHRLEDTGVVLPLAYASSSAKERRGRASIQQVWQPKPESRSAEALNAVAAGPIQHKQPNAIAEPLWPRTSPC